MARALGNARKIKNDEFYTELSEIQAELSNYADKFEGKVVYCNCDDPFESNFIKYFLMNFNRLGLKELIATGYKTSPVRGTELNLGADAYAMRVTDTKKYLVGTQTDLDVAGAKYFLTAEKDKIIMPLIGNPALDDEGNQIQVLARVGTGEFNKKGKEKTKIVKQDLYYEAGDFRSDMSISLLEQSDIVVTNPPFSLFRDYITQLISYKKQFLILGPMNSISYKEVFPLFKNNNIWFGCKGGSKEYMVSDAYAEENPNKFYSENGKKYSKMGNTAWFTNIDHAKRHQMLPLDFGYRYYAHEDYYPRYENFNGINIDKVSEIPCDYMGIMGVPITFMDKYCPEQFDILGFGAGILGIEAGVTPYDRTLKPLSDALRDGIPYLYNKKLNKVTVPYARLFIKFTDSYISTHPELFKKE